MASKLSKLYARRQWQTTTASTITTHTGVEGVSGSVGGGVGLAGKEYRDEHGKWLDRCAFSLLNLLTVAWRLHFFCTTAQFVFMCHMFYSWAPKSMLLIFHKYS